MAKNSSPTSESETGLKTTIVTVSRSKTARTVPEIKEDHPEV